jgi:fibronectin-binding autotransporter adhesin
MHQPTNSRRNHVSKVRRACTQAAPSSRNGRLYLAVVATLAALPASAATWDGGDGVWSTTVGKWDAGNNWVQGSAAVFSGTPGIVSLGEAITAASISLNANNHTVDLSGFNLTVSGTTGGTAVLLGSNTVTNTNAAAATFTTGTLSTAGPVLSGNMHVTYTGGGWNTSVGHDFTGTLSLLGTGLVRSDGVDLGINSSSALLRMGGTQTLQLGAVGSSERVYARNIELLVTGGGIQPNGPQTLILSGNISGTGNFNRLLGQGMIVLAGNNTFTGKVTFPTGNSFIVAASPTAFGAANVDPLLNVVEGGSNSNSVGFMGNVDVNGAKRITLAGGLRADGAGNLHNISGTNSFAGDIAISNNQVFMVEPDSQLTLKGIFSGGRALNKHGGGTLVLANQMTITNGGNNGAFRELLSVFDGTVVLDFDQPTSPNFGIINAALSTTAAQPAFSGGTIEIKGQAGEANSDFFDDGLLVNVGASEFKITQNGATSVGVRLGSMGARSAGGTLNFTLAEGTQSIYTAPQTGNGFTTTRVNANGILGGYATAGKTSWATTGNAAGTYNVTAYAHTVDEQGATAFDTVSNNVDITAANTAAPVSNKTVNSLRFAAGGTLTLDGTNLLTSGGILVTGSTNGTITGGTLQGGASTDLIVHQNSTARFTIASNISNNTGATGLTKSGPGTLALSGANDYTGATFVLGGVLLLDSLGALPGGLGATGGTSKLVLKGGVVGLTSDFSRGIGTGPTAPSDKVQWLGSGGFAAYGGTRAVNLGGTATWHNGSYDSGNVVQTSGSYTGGFVPFGAKLLFGAADADGMIDFQSNIDLRNNNQPLTRIIEVADSAAAEVEARISGILLGSESTSLTKTGNGTLELTAINTFIGGTIVEGGGLKAGALNAIPNGRLTVRGGKVDFNGFGFTVNNGLTMGGGAAGTQSEIASGAGTLTLNSNFTYAGNAGNDNGAMISGNIDLGAVDRVFTVNNSTATANDVVVFGDIGGTGGLTKTGAGTLQLAGNNSYTGTTIVAEGVLGVSGSLSGSSAVLVNGGTLAGTGGVGVVTLTTGSIAPGNSAGTLNTGDVFLNGGALAIELISALSFDQINVAGLVQFGGPVNLSLSLASTFAANTSFTIINNNLTDPVTFTDALSGLVYNGNALEEGEMFAVTGGFGTQAFQISYAGGTDLNDVVLTAVPEPGSAMMVLAGLGGLLGFQRRRTGRRTA